MEIIWPGPAAPFGHLKKAIVKLTDAEIKHLPNLGIQIVPAPGPKKLNIPVITIFSLNSTIAYLNTTGYCVLYLAWEQDDAASNLVKGSTFFSSGSNTIAIALCSQFQDAEAGDYYPSLLSIRADSQADFFLMIKAGTDDGLDFTGGAPTNTLIVTTYYLTVDV